MTHCWREGELRAYLDGELPAQEMERLAAHLKECAVCGELSAELERRAAWMASALGALPVREPVLRTEQRRTRRPATIRRWTGAAIALAASLVLALVLLPKGTEKRVVEGPLAAAAPAAPAAQAPVTVKPAIIRRLAPRKKAAPSKPKPQLEYFLALDDDPVETGIVVRVALDGGRVPADVIVGADGRPHAIRLISNVAGER